MVSDRRPRHSGSDAWALLLSSRPDRFTNALGRLGTRRHRFHLLGPRGDCAATTRRGLTMTALRDPLPEIAVLLTFIDEAFDRRSWHGPNLRGSIRGISAQQALWRPAPGRHNIWELVLHAAYWKYVVRRRITGEKRGSFVLGGSNYFQSPDSPDDA